MSVWISLISIAVIQRYNIIILISQYDISILYLNFRRRGTVNEEQVGIAKQKVSSILFC